METCGDCSFGYIETTVHFYKKNDVSLEFFRAHGLDMESCRSRSNAQCVKMNVSGMNRCGDARIHTEWRRQRKENGAVLR